MNYDEFPIIKEKYVPICEDMDKYMKESTPINPFRKVVEVIKEVIVEVPIEIPVYIPIKKQRKKQDSFKFPQDWSEDLKTKYRSYYYRCRQKGKQFSLTFEEFKNFFEQSCKFCGSNESITIDRIDSNIGYEPFNCQPCCNTCNMMKHSLTEYKFLEKISQVYHYQSNI